MPAEPRSSVCTSPTVIARLTMLRTKLSLTGGEEMRVGRAAPARIALRDATRTVGILGFPQHGRGRELVRR